MSSQYSPKTFLRQVRGRLINRCLRRRGIDLDLDIEVIKPSVVDEMFQKLTSLPPEKLRLVEADFAAIAELSSSRATNAILREASRYGLDFADIFLQARNGYERACWTFLEHHDIFERAACFYEMDSYGDGRWNRRFVGAGLTPATTEQAIARLSVMMQRSFAKEGRGKHCHIDYYLREEPTRHCFFAMPEDHPSTDFSYSESGELRRQTRKGAFEVIFVYRPADGMLEVLAPGGCNRVEDMAACFCTGMLNLPDLPPKITPRLYDLSRLKAANLSFATDPADRIERVELREVRLGLGRADGWRRLLNFAVDRKAYDRASIHDMILGTVAADGVELADVVVASARFCIIFAAVDNQKPKRLTFSVAQPDRCTLRDNYHDQIARKCLRLWGLTVDTGSARIAV